jgi:TolB protein
MADTKDVTRLTSCQAACDGEGSPAWAPDGTKLAFWSLRDGKEGLWIINADGSGLKLLSPGLSVGQPAWSPDGQTIAAGGTLIEPGGGGGPSEIFLVDAKNGRLIKRIQPQEIEPRFGVTWSPDGQWLAFDAVGEGGLFEGAGIFQIRPDGTGLKKLTEWFACNACRALDPVWSPDGTKIVFTRGGGEFGSDGTVGDLFVLDLETGVERRLTDGPGLDCCASWQAVP